MAEKSIPARCAITGCGRAISVGQYLCSDHRVKTPTVRELIAAGPRYEDTNGNASCVACQQPDTGVDVKTGLCLGCWRPWRFSTERKVDVG